MANGRRQRRSLDPTATRLGRRLTELIRRLRGERVRDQAPAPPGRER